MNVLRLASVAILFFSAFHLRADDAAAPQTLRYTILQNGVVSGHEADTYRPGGRVDSTFEFNDRGRGPKIDGHYLLQADGLPSHTDLTGNDYLKAPVDEHFSIEKNAAERDAVHWSSTAEKGQASSPGFYISINGPSAEIGFLAAALLKAKNGRVKLLPAGEAGLERLTDVTLEDHGQKLHVTDYAITGLSYEPETVWLDDDQRFFGTPGKWFSILRDGWGGANARLYALDRAAEDARNARLAGDLAQHPAHPLAVEHVRVFDSERAAMREDQTVVI